MNQPRYSDEYWESPDGLKLHYRNYPGRADRPPLICIPGLTRNARDFEALAGDLAGEWRVICVELRGRGMSDYAKDPSTYVPQQYIADIEALLEQANIARFIAIGTSLGGIVTMLLALGSSERMAGALLNDVGPVIEPAGMARIRDHVGQGGNFPTWMHAARALKESQADAFPNYEVTDWLALAKRLMVLGGGGRIAFDYDMKIAEPFNAPQAASSFDMWPAWRSLEGRPLLVLRGETSDILSGETLERMKREVPEAETVTIPGVGHPPSLDEPEARAAIARLLVKCA